MESVCYMLHGGATVQEEEENEQPSHSRQTIRSTGYQIIRLIDIFKVTHYIR